jgi:hypothetical protein
MPYADLAAFEKDRRLTAVSDLFTVNLIVSYIGWKLGQVGAGANGATTEACPRAQEARGVAREVTTVPTHAPCDSPFTN